MEWMAGASLLGSAANLFGGINSAAGAANNNSMVNANNQQQIALQIAANQQNATMAQNQMDFQREMSNTAYQRQMADMRAAGLNPILAYQKGGGSSTPPGASGTASGTSLSNSYQNPGAEMARGVGNAVSSATDTYKTYYAAEAAKAQAAKDVATEELTKETIPKTNAETAKTQADFFKIRAETDLTREQTLTEAVRRVLVANEGDVAAQNAGLKRLEQEYFNKSGPGWVGDPINTIRQIIWDASKGYREGWTSRNIPQAVPRVGDPNQGIP
ncbi:MAG: DNA pilot protein [Microvirus sp.]|nr:MAG: DNA pilot protein [Microvirus sp.]